jgi:archaemetzincin
MEVFLLPVAANLDDNALPSLAYDISREFENKMKITVGTPIELDSEPEFQSVYHIHRNQWESTKLLYWFHKKFNPSTEAKVLAISDLDAYSNRVNFVLGEAAIYLPRIKQEFYGLKPNERLFYERMVKEAVHELGHTFGFSHCKNSLCVMHFSNSLHDTDIKERSFCTFCRNWL